MPSLLLVAPSFNGKTSILERFVAQHPAVVDPDGEKSICEVVMIEAPPTPDVSAFYSRILDALMAIYKPTASAQAKNSQIKILFEQLGVKMLIVDEIHHLIEFCIKVGLQCWKQQEKSLKKVYDQFAAGVYLVLAQSIWSFFNQK
jgi:hypothetical protein